MKCAGKIPQVHERTKKRASAIIFTLSGSKNKQKNHGQTFFLLISDCRSPKKSNSLTAFLLSSRHTVTLDLK